MSRIGKQSLNIPKQVEVKINESSIFVKGPKGELTQIIPDSLEIIKKDDNTLQVLCKSENRLSRALHGLIRSLVSNMLIGVSQGFNKVLDLKGVGYRASVDKGVLNLTVGYTHPVKIAPPPGIKISVDGNTTVKVEGVDKEKVGLIAQQIRFVRPPEPYKGKGIMYRGEIIQRKVGKSSK
uniref:Large ribosomal subunit protein uL6c n=1 Tax=Eustigmatophyceae sp. Mont 10/10-1w TaxID=2506145 RepID=A0A3R5T920_9STRA|nr:ribosomal protein L6 [Eustigmatophyceae sp. Mont 10/10-1w]QAA11677.1 ribosomal protein L6 [Eustigmatophyceae sp. Mont 10/10-1w]